MVILIADLFFDDSKRYITYALSQFTLLGAALMTVLSYNGSVSYAFSNMFVDDTLAHTLKMMIYLSTSVVFVYSRNYIAQRGMYRGEFFVLVLFAMLGMMVLVSGQNFLSLYMGLELLSLCLYALVALERDNPRATEAAMKYFVLGADRKSTRLNSSHSRRSRMPSSA